MITVPNLKVLKSLPSTPRDGEYAIVENPTEQIYIYKNNNWEKCEGKGSIDVSLYEINATAIAQLPSHNDDPEQIKKDIELINDYITEQFDQEFFLLICKELPNKSFYLTILQRDKYNASLSSSGEEVIDLLSGMGTIHALSKEDSGIMEIWVKDPEENMICFMLFPGDDFIVEVN